MALIRTENPGLLLVMSPLPSYELVAGQPLDSALLRALGRVPVSYQYGVRQEGELYEKLRVLASEEGWLFVDNLAALRSYQGSERLYNNSTTTSYRRPACSWVRPRPPCCSTPCAQLAHPSR